MVNKKITLWTGPLALTALKMAAFRIVTLANLDENGILYSSADKDLNVFESESNRTICSMILLLTFKGKDLVFVEVRCHWTK
ncbi:MAG TPA: hypothetical protein VLX29_11855 [Nitrospirota bacterium]|nr:hypothetical protein [Nitrospirota bacterium]